MKLIKIVLPIIIVFFTGCSETIKEPELVQINKSSIYISSNPIEHDSELKIEFKHTDEIIDNLNFFLDSDLGPSGIISEDVKLYEVSSANNSVIQTIKVEQDKNVLFSKTTILTKENFNELSSYKLNSKDFQSPLLKGAYIKISIEYKRRWKHEKYGINESLV
jgi:hypothetical protein